MANYTDEQLGKFAADVVSGLSNAHFTPEQVAGVLAWGLGQVFLRSSCGLTKTQYLANVVTTVDKCIKSSGSVRLVDG